MKKPTKTMLQEIRRALQEDDFERRFESFEEYQTCALCIDAVSQWYMNIPMREAKFHGLNTPMERYEFQAVHHLGNEVLAEENKLIMEFVPDIEKSHLFLPLRDCSTTSRNRRCKIEGSALELLKEQIPSKLAELLNITLLVIKDEALVRVSGGKINALHSHEYSIMPIPILLEKLKNYFSEYLEKANFMDAYISHSYTQCAFCLSAYNTTHFKKYKDLLEKGFQPVVCFSTSDTAINSVKLSPKLYDANRNFIPLAGNLVVPHKGESPMDKFEENLTMLIEQFQHALETLAELKKIKIEHPKTCMLRVLRRLAIPKKYAYECAETFDAYHDSESECTAYDIYLRMIDIIMLARKDMCDMDTIVRTEDAIARAFGIRWKDYDISGDFLW